jgi:hypothetical protein
MRISLTVPVRTLVIAVVALVVAAGGGYAVASTTGGGSISACAKKSNGALRMATKCQKSEKKVSWAIQGPAGTPGAPGQNGVNLFARVDDTGALQHQHSPGVTVKKLTAGLGQYEVTFPQDVTSCAPVVSEASNANNSFTKGALFEALDEGDYPTFNPHTVLVLVTAYDATADTATPVDAGFDLILAC